MYSDNMIGKKWASDDLFIVRQTENNWVISFRSGDILFDDRSQELVSVFSCLIDCIDFPCGIVFDFSSIEHLNEDELGNFLAVALPFQDSGCQVLVCSLSVQMLELFEDQNLEGQFHLAAGQEDALFALSFNETALSAQGRRF